MGRQEWEDSLKVGRSDIERARMHDNGSLCVSRQQAEKWNEQVDKALSLLQAGDASHLDFLDGSPWYHGPHCERFYYQTKGNQTLVKSPEDANRQQRSGVLL